MKEEQYSVTIVDGDWTQWKDDLLGVQSLKYEGITWSDAVSLARLSFKEKYTVVIWRVDDAGEEEHAETQSGGAV